MNLERILCREQDILFLFSQDQRETFPSFVVVIGGEAKPITCVITNAQKNTTKNAR